MSDITKIKIADGNEGGVVLCLLGVLSESRALFAPIAKTLSRAGVVYGFDEAHERMNNAELSMRVRETMKSARRDSKSVVLLGASKGGVHVPFIMEKYRLHYPGYDLSWLRVILADAPAGVETMPAAPNWAAGIFQERWLGESLRGMIGPTIVKHGFAGDDSLPKPDETELPEGAHETFDEFYRRIREEAKAQLLMQDFGLWWQHMGWMIRVVKNGSLALACTSLSGVNTTYLMCTHPGNGVVEQPKARDWYDRHISGMKTVDVNGVHVGFLQQQLTFNAAFEKILGY